ncbi:mCG16301, isoform CRA_b, partial [Mus musculus]
PPFSPWQRPGTCAPRSYSEASSPWSAPPSIPSTSGPLCGWRNTILLVSFIFKLAAHMTMASVRGVIFLLNHSGPIILKATLLPGDLYLSKD